MTNNLDFDYLSNLYKTDPEKFEAIRTQEIENVISQAGDKEQKRLRGLQFQIDSQREIHKHSAMGACIAISQMMHESFEELRFQLNLATNSIDPLGGTSRVYQPMSMQNEGTSNVIPLRR